MPLNIANQTIRRFLECGRAAQKDIDKIIIEHQHDLAVKEAYEKAIMSGSRKDLEEYLRLRSEV